MDSAQTIGQTLPTASRSGAGFVELSSVVGRTAVTHCRANSPLRLLTPQCQSPTARIISATYGGGLLAGDAIELTVDAGPATQCLLSTQASTKIYRSDAAPCTQTLRVTTADHTIIVSLPDPIVCFAGSRFAQTQQFDLVPNASLLMLDWFTSGRAARGERWAMHYYKSQSQVTVGGQTVYREFLELNPRDGPIAGPMRMAGINCFATAILLGPAFSDQASALVQRTQRQPIIAGNPLMFGASPLNGGALLRVAGDSTQSVANWLREQLSFVPDVIDLDPWQRKW